MKVLHSDEKGVAEESILQSSSYFIATPGQLGVHVAQHLNGAISKRSVEECFRNGVEFDV